MELHNKTGSARPESDSASNMSLEDSHSPASKERAVTQTLEERFPLRGDRQQRRLSQVQQPRKLLDVAEAQMAGRDKKRKIWKQEFLKASSARLCLTYKFRQRRRLISRNKLCISQVMRWLSGELESQETHEESSSGKGEKGIKNNRNFIHKVMVVHKTATSEVSNGTSWRYFNQLCLYLQNKETFDHCSRNNRVSEFCGHVVLTIQNQQVSCKTTQGRMSNWRRWTVCRRLRGRKKREGAIQPADSGLTWTASAAGQVKTGRRWWQLPVPNTGMLKKKKL